MNLAAAVSGLDAGTTTGSCATVGSNCVCTSSASNDRNDQTGTYTVAGSTLSTTVSANGSPPSESVGYCVQGSTLYITSPMGSGSSMATSVGIVATKE